jgi:hypothetical protein
MGYSANKRRKCIWFRNNPIGIAKKPPSSDQQGRWVRGCVLEARCGIVVSVSQANNCVYMTSTSPTLRVLTTAGSVVLVWLLSVSAASAAHTPRRGSSRRVCDPQTTGIRRFPRVPKTFGGPLAKPSIRTLAGLTDPLARLLRGGRANQGDEAQAIQNDAPASPIVAGPVPQPQALGAFVQAFEQRPHTRAFSPRSPRGPPVSA